MGGYLLGQILDQQEFQEQQQLQYIEHTTSAAEQMPEWLSFLMRSRAVALYIYEHHRSESNSHAPYVLTIPPYRASTHVFRARLFNMNRLTGTKYAPCGPAVAPWHTQEPSARTLHPNQTE